MVANYSWTLHRELPETSHKKKSNIATSPAKEKDSKRPLNKV
jgi:hypothetical protein